MAYPLEATIRDAYAAFGRGRALTIACIIALAGGLLGVAQTSFTSQSPTSAGPADPELIRDLVVAYRILADQGILDAMGHVSVRHNRNPKAMLNNNLYKSSNVGYVLCSGAPYLTCFSGEDLDEGFRNPE